MIRNYDGTIDWCSVVMISMVTSLILLAFSALLYEGGNFCDHGGVKKGRIISFAREGVVLDNGDFIRVKDVDLLFSTKFPPGCAIEATPDQCGAEAKYVVRRAVRPPVQVSSHSWEVTWKPLLGALLHPAAVVVYVLTGSVVFLRKTRPESKP